MGKLLIARLYIEQETFWITPRKLDFSLIEIRGIDCCCFQQTTKKKMYEICMTCKGRIDFCQIIMVQTCSIYHGDKRCLYFLVLLPAEESRD